jgi:protein-S-isoprenylcysteine O-methyltransferase Ste14
MSPCNPATKRRPVWIAHPYVVYALVSGFTAWIVVMPLDARRFGWSPQLPLWLKAVGAVLLLLSSPLMFRSYMDNTFVSLLVRVQTDRQHRVVSTGVFGIARHPMYLAGTLMFIGTPPLFGSMIGLLGAVSLTILLAARIIGEEKTLAAELEGYQDYRKRVRYRLVPLVG